nr:MAG TPA: hypothetical protein [Caudoviricetes sp.]
MTEKQTETPTSKLVGNKLECRTKDGRFAKGHKPVTSFKDRPQDRANGRWDKNNSYSYWLNKFGTMSHEDRLAWQVENPPEKRSGFCQLALDQYTDARKAITSDARLRVREAIADRVEGRPKQVIKQVVEVSDPYEGLTTEELKKLLAKKDQQK